MFHRTPTLRWSIIATVFIVKPFLGAWPPEAVAGDSRISNLEIRIGAALPANTAGASWNHRFITASALVSQPLSGNGKTEFGLEVSFGVQYEPGNAYLAALQGFVRQPFRVHPNGSQVGLELAFGAALSDVGTPATGQPLNFLTSAAITFDWPARFLGTDGTFVQYSHLSNGGLNQINNGLDQLYVGLRRKF